MAMYYELEAKITHQKIEIARLRDALEATQWGIIDRCPVCAGWDMGPYGETDHIHCPDCIVGLALKAYA